MNLAGRRRNLVFGNERKWYDEKYFEGHSGSDKHFTGKFMVKFVFDTSFCGKDVDGDTV